MSNQEAIGLEQGLEKTAGMPVTYEVDRILSLTPPDKLETTRIALLDASSGNPREALPRLRAIRMAVEEVEFRRVQRTARQEFQKTHIQMLKDIQAGQQSQMLGALILGGQFTLAEVMKGGKHAVAFKGARITDNAPVFVKINPNIIQNHELYDHLIQARETILSINHANLLKAVDIGLNGADWWEVYEWNRGKQFTDWLTDERNKNESGRPNNNTIDSMVRQLADGLHSLHEVNRAVHRDLKPANIMVTEDSEGHPIFRIIDYSALIQIDTGGIVLGVGTPEYAPPEFKSCVGLERNDLLRSWDWWTLGRLVQEVVDGIHHLARLRAKYAGQIANLQPWQELAPLMSVSLEMMAEQSFDRFGIHAGAVEYSEYDSEARGTQKFMPLLRGLLTNRRTARWRYEDIMAFLDGKHVADSYREFPFAPTRYRSI